MQISSKCLFSVLALLFSAWGSTYAQDPAHATEFRMQRPGNGPDVKPRIAFFTDCLGTDYDEGISMLDMNGDGSPDLLIGAYGYDILGPNGCEWHQQQSR